MEEKVSLLIAGVAEETPFENYKAQLDYESCLGLLDEHFKCPVCLFVVQQPVECVKC